MTVPECASCIYYVQTGNVCAYSTPIHMDPGDGECYGFDVADSRAPNRSQISLAMYDNFAKSELQLIMEHGRIVDVEVPFLPETELLNRIPQKPLSFALVNESTMGFLTNSKDTTQPWFLICGLMGDIWGEPLILKKWNEPVQERASMTMNRVLVALTPFLQFLQGRVEREGYEIFTYYEEYTVEDTQRLLKYWEEMGYQVGEKNGHPFMAYSYNGGNFIAVFDDEASAYFEVNPPSFDAGRDTEPLMALSLSTRCLGCGYDSESWTAPRICPACKVEYPEIRFKEER